MLLLFGEEATAFVAVSFLGRTPPALRTTTTAGPATTPTATAGFSLGKEPTAFVACAVPDSPPAASGAAAAAPRLATSAAAFRLESTRLVTRPVPGRAAAALGPGMGFTAATTLGAAAAAPGFAAVAAVVRLEPAVLVARSLGFAASPSS